MSSVVSWREDLARAAGFFNGEGTTWGGPRKDRGPRLALSLPQKDKRELEVFRTAVLGLGTVIKRDRNCWVWQVQNWRDSQAVLAMLWPFLSAQKKEQALAAVKKFRDQPNWGAPIGNPNWRKKNASS